MILAIHLRMKRGRGVAEGPLRSEGGIEQVGRLNAHGANALERLAGAEVRALVHDLL